MRKVMTVLVGLISMFAGVADPVAGPIERAGLGRSIKLTILVDKVMQPTAGWTTQEWMVKEAAKAGFNVFSPRVGYDRFEDVRRVTAWCSECGIYHMPWMRGSLEAPKGPEADGRRLVWASGNEQPLWSPNSDAFWDWTNKYIVEYAKMSAENPHIMGVFLDYENYAPGKEGNLYELSYDDLILGKFASAQRLELPQLALEARKSWLEEKGLHDAFAAFQIDHWRDRCRALRQAVDAHNPEFRFCIYPAPGTRFMVEATYPEWATAQAPLILADACTYGRPSRFLDERRSLERNREKLLKRMETPIARGIPFIYAGGIDAIVGGADAEFSGKNAVMISEVTGGYWVFYEGPKYDTDHADYFRWFTWANGRIAAGEFAAWQEPRRTAENWSLTIFGDIKDAFDLVAPEVTSERVSYGPCELRGENLVVIAAKAGQRVEIELENRPLGDYESPLVWEVRDAAGAGVALGRIDYLQSGVAAFTPETSGLYVLGLSAGPCAYSITASNAPLGLHARQGLGLVRAARRLYFYVPESVEQFMIAAKGMGGETVRVNVHDPEGGRVATAQTSAGQESVRIDLRSGPHAGAVWFLETTKADEGAFEDHTLTLDPKLPLTVALDPMHVFR